MSIAAEESRVQSTPPHPTYIAELRLDGSTEEREQADHSKGATARAFAATRGPSRHRESLESEQGRNKKKSVVVISITSMEMRKVDKLA